MRKIILLILCASWAFAYGQSQISKIALPCDSSFQLLSPTGNHAAIRCKDNSWNIIELPSGKPFHQIPAHPSVTAYSFSADGKWFVSGAMDGTIRLLPLTGDSEAITWRPHEVGPDVVQMLGSGELLIAPHEKPGEIWQLAAERKLIATLPTDFSGITFATASPDGQLLATGGADTTVRIYDTKSWKLTHEFRELTLEPFAGSFTPDGKYLLVGGADNRITVIDPHSGAEIRKLPASPDVIAEINPLADNNHVAAVQWDADGRNPPYVSLWNLQTGKAERIQSSRKITGGGVVKGAAWFASAFGETMEVWTEQGGVAGK